jgi:hypothetical protein
MKKLFLIATIPSVSVVANAQLKYGVKGGMNLASMNYTGGKMLTGFHGGFLLQAKLAMFAIQPEVLFSMQGTGVEGSDDKTKLNYINVPVMLQYFVLPGLAIEAGPQVGLLLSAKSNDEDIKKDCNTIDFGVAAGASFKFPIIPVGVFARYTMGFSDIGKNGGNDAGKNRVIQFGAFFRF